MEDSLLRWKVRYLPVSWEILLEAKTFAAHAVHGAVTFLGSGSHVTSVSQRSLPAKKEGTISRLHL